MKKLTLLILFLFSNFLIFAQNEVVSVNTNSNVHLIFNSKIKKADVGNPNYSIIYNDGDKILIVKAIKSSDTNLFVVTESGLMYNFILSYSEDLNQYYKIISENVAINFIKKEDAFSKEISEVNLEKEKKNPKVSRGDVEIQKTDSAYNITGIRGAKNLYKFNKSEYLRKRAVNFAMAKPFFMRSFVDKDKINLRLLNINYDKNELYFSFEIENSSGMDLDIEYIEHAIAIKKLKKRSNSQAIHKPLIYGHKVPKKIKGNSKTRFVLVFDKFTVSRKKVFLISIKEKDGERDIEFPISHKMINNPN